MRDRTPQPAVVGSVESWGHRRSVPTWQSQIRSIRTTCRVLLRCRRRIVRCPECHSGALTQRPGRLRSGSTRRLGAMARPGLEPGTPRFSGARTARAGPRSPLYRAKSLPTSILDSAVVRGGPVPWRGPEPPRRSASLRPFDRHPSYRSRNSLKRATGSGSLPSGSPGKVLAMTTESWLAGDADRPIFEELRSGDGLFAMPVAREAGVGGDRDVAHWS